jgi:hypothetical protein
MGWEQEMHYTSSHLTKPDVALGEQQISAGYSVTTNSSLFVRAYSKLLRFDRYLVRRDFAGLYRAVRTAPCTQKSADANAMDRICHTVDLACIWYWKEVLCLQRSAATTCLLRNFGIPARMILGVQQTPFRAHAWVEAGGQVINDRQYMRDLYKVIDIC